jgi:hypothetical protein
VSGLIHQGMVNEFFQKLFSANHNRSEWFNTEISFPILEADDINKLALPVQNDEIKSALFSIFYISEVTIRN